MVNFPNRILETCLLHSNIKNSIATKNMFVFITSTTNVPLYQTMSLYMHIFSCMYSKYAVRKQYLKGILTCTEKLIFAFVAMERGFFFSPLERHVRINKTQTWNPSMQKDCSIRFHTILSRPDIIVAILKRSFTECWLSGLSIHACFVTGARLVLPIVQNHRYF